MATSRARVHQEAAAANVSRYTRDYTTHWTQRWTSWFSAYANRPHVHVLEVGCFEGRTSIWLLEQVLQHETSTLTCIDPFPAAVFHENIRPYRHKVRLCVEWSAAALIRREFAPESFDVIYVDAALRAAPVLEDMVLSFPLLAPGGLMIVACYRWGIDRGVPPRARPQLAADAFTDIYAREATVLDDGWQLLLRRNDR
jgi:predicted O-methyltransferase YrrM